MKSRPYRAQFIAYVLAMMADNVEHVISYWVVFQKFHSPALAGFAVLSHWLPFLLFSVAVGGLGRPVRSTPHHSVRDAALHRGVGGLGHFLHHRHASDVARDAAPGHPRLRRRAVADAEPAAALRHRRPRRSAERGTAERDGALSGNPGRSGRGRRDHAGARPIPRHHSQHACSICRCCSGCSGRPSAPRAQWQSASPSAALPTSCRPSASSAPTLS